MSIIFKRLGVCHEGHWFTHFFSFFFFLICLTSFGIREVLACKRSWQCSSQTVLEKMFNQCYSLSAW